MDDFNKPFKEGSLICHFKRELCSQEEQKNLKYVYSVVGYAYDTRDLTGMMIYKEVQKPYRIWARPLTEVRDLVDRRQYHVQQLHRFEYYV